MDSDRSMCTVGDNPDHLLKTVEEKWKRGPTTAADGRFSSQPSGVRLAFRLHASATYLLNHAGSANRKIVSHLVNQEHARAGENLQPTMFLLGGSERYPIAAMFRQHREGHVPRRGEN